MSGPRLALRQWWLVLLLPFGFTSWLAFLYVGLRARHARWLVASAIYLAVTVLVVVRVNSYSDQNGFLKVMTTVGLFGLWLGTMGHALSIRREFLHRVEARKNPSRAGTFTPTTRSARDFAISSWSITLLCVFFMGLGVWCAWESLSRPGTYETLERRGVVTQAEVSYHRQLSPDDDYYTLDFTFGGESISKTYHNNYAQFRGLPQGATVPVMVDPQDPDTVFTVTDVRARTNAGFGVLFFFGVGAFLAGFIWLVSHIRENRRHERDMDAIRRRW